MKKVINLNYLFWINYFLLILSEMLNNIMYISNFINTFNMIGILGICLFILVNNKTYSFKYIFFFVPLIICSIYLYVKLNDFTLLKLCLLLVALKSIPFEDFIKKEFCIRIFLFLSAIILSLFGLSIGSEFYVRNTTRRYTLGFVHPNTTGFYLFLIAVEYIYINRNKMTNIKYVFPIIVAILINILTDSRTSFIALVMIILGELYINLSKKKLLETQIAKFILPNLYVILTVITFSAVSLYNSGNVLTITLNNLFSDRLFYYVRFVNEYKINMMGNYFETYILDNSYLHLLLRFGLITYLFYYYLFSKKIKISYIEKDYTLIAIFTIMLFFGLTENVTYKPTYNIFLLSCANIINKKRKNDK